jgi:hypothetical protein
MPSRVDLNRVNEILGGDPLLTPPEAAAQLGISEDELYGHACAGRVPCLQPGGPGSWRRYRTSVITRLAAEGIPQP